MFDQFLLAIETVLDGAHGTIISITTTLLLALLATLMSRPLLQQLVGRLIKNQKNTTTVEKQKRVETLVAVFSTAAHVLIWVVAVLVVLNQLYVNIVALLTGAGLFGVIIGFGAQNTVKDILAGIFIISENQYRVGDIVSLYASGRDVAGVVERITIRITQLRDLDGKVHIVRNGTADIISNLTFHFANVNVNVLVDYASDVDKVEDIINETGQALADDPTWHEHIYEPIKFLRVDEFETSGVRIKALGKVEPAKQWEVAGEFRRRLKKAFEKRGVVIPYPQIVVSQRAK